MGFMEKAIQFSKEKMISEIMSLLPKFSTKNVMRMISLGEKLTNDPEYRQTAVGLRKMFEEGHPAAILIKEILNDMSPNCRNKLIKNLFINAFLIGIDKRKQFLETEGFQPPQFVVISPTMRCNLRCKGCYASEYEQSEDLPFEVIDRVLTECKELGSYFNVMSGGEVFIRDDIFDIWEKHGDMYFHPYTNGTLIDEKIADRIEKLGNVIPLISLEGFEEETDARRGRGTYAKVMRAMDLLLERHVIFGASLTETRQNIERIASFDFVDWLIEKGVRVIWYFQYIPIGRKPSMEFMPKPEQRDWLRHRIDDLRNSRPVFIGDFWNDGPYVKGCIAGGREYLHITASGDVEPCVFCHFAVDNIKEKSLRDILTSPYMRAIRSRQPYRENLLTPCMIIDEPHVLRDVVQEFNAHPTCEGAEDIITTFASDLDRYSKEYRKYADPAWEKEWKKSGEEEKKVV